MMRIVLVGSGAREHAIARAIKKSQKQAEIFCCGTHLNPGIQLLTSDYWVGDICNIEMVRKQAIAWQANMAIIGPEAPLEMGLADEFWNHSIATIGPTKRLAKIETSKIFARDLLQQYKVAGSPLYKNFLNMEGVQSFLEQLGQDGYVIKANGLMGGKGVKVAGDHLSSFQEALEFCRELLELKQTFVIEEKVIGEEFSLLCFCDGYSLIAMPVIQDHKRAYNNDEGPNTGGMGSYSDANHRLPFLTEKDIEQALHINQAMISSLTNEYQERYIGILYGSFMATKDGVRLIEFNARFGDPEAMNALAILETDFVEICNAMISGRLSEIDVRFKNLATVCKYAVPHGYPDHPVKNELVDVSHVINQDLLYFGAVSHDKNLLHATGSRAIAVVGVGETIYDAEKIAEAEINRLKGKLFHRSDIGTNDLIQRRIRHMETLRQCYV